MIKEKKSVCGTKPERFDQLARIGDARQSKFIEYKSNLYCYQPVNAGPMGEVIQSSQILALNNCSNRTDLIAARQYFYISELAWLKQYFEFEKGASSVLTAPLPSGFHVLLSGAKHLRQLFASLRISRETEENINRYAGYISYLQIRLQQAAMVCDLEQVTYLANELSGRTKADFEVGQSLLSFYRALVTEDTEQVEAALAIMLNPKMVNKTNRHYKGTILGKMMCHPGMWLAKLAWLNGHHIEIDHPLIISELLPDETNDSYDEHFDFLIDPVLRKADFKLFGGSEPAHEVEQHNQAIYQAHIAITAPEFAL